MFSGYRTHDVRGQSPLSVVMNAVCEKIAVRADERTVSATFRASGGATRGLLQKPERDYIEVRLLSGYRITGVG